MKVLLTSAGSENKRIEETFLALTGKKPEDIKAVFIPAAAIDADAIEVLPKCLHDLLDCGILWKEYGRRWIYCRCRPRA